jgi:phytoene/squalene synthetase
MEMTAPNIEPDGGPGATLAVAITRAASAQSYYTIRFLADNSRVDDAFRAYAYFRWVDDWLDLGAHGRVERLAFVARQQALLEACTREEPPADLVPEERLLVDLVRREAETNRLDVQRGPREARNSGLQLYLRNMMAVMAFDAARCGRAISGRELDEYTRWLAVGVTEALHHFIGHNCASPRGEARYLAVTGAHIVHMLRDAREDAEAGYFNIPSEVLAAGGIAPWDVESRAYRDWVRERVRKARACFTSGQAYLGQAESLRCRIAGYAYIHRFAMVLDCIEREGYLLRWAYPERKGGSRVVETLGGALWLALTYRQQARLAPAIPAR